MPVMRFALPLLALSSGLVLAEPFLALNRNFADPCIIQAGGNRLVAFATNNPPTNVQIAYSENFDTWTYLDQDALPGPFPEWVWDTPSVWAPDVIRRDDGLYVMYFSAIPRKDNRKHCVGIATSSSVTGPYIPTNSSLACPVDQGGAIDAAGFRDDDGTFYVVYKVDGSNLNQYGGIHPTPLMLQKMKSDAITPVGNPVVLLDRIESDGSLIEAPSIVKVGGTYYLSFSSHMYNVLGYDVKYATASSVAGPYTRAAEPLLSTGNESSAGTLGGPGGADISEDGTMMLFHAFKNGQNLDEGRSMYAARVTLQNGVITVE